MPDPNQTNPEMDEAALFPDMWGNNYAKAARETKTNWINDMLEESLKQAGSEAERLAKEEERRGSKAEDTLRGAIDAANVPTLSQADIDRLFSKGVDTSGAAFKQTIGNLRSMLGANGLTGASGFAGGLAADAEAQRLASLVGSRRDLLIQKSVTDATDRLNQYDRMTDLTSLINRPVAMQVSDFLQMLAGMNLTRLDNQLGYNAAKDAANAGKTAGIMNGIGGILGGIGSFL